MQHSVKGICEFLICFGSADLYLGVSRFEHQVFQLVVCTFLLQLFVILLVK